MLKIAPIALLLFSISHATTPINRSTRPVSSRNSSTEARTIPTLGYCALLEHATTHVGKLVRLKATWQFGFEATLLNDRKCPQQPGAWLEFADEKELCPQTRKNQSTPGHSDKEADITVVGRLYGPGRYGHLGDYQFKFVAVCLEKIKVTSSDLK
jgi:hypothetical protein